MALTKRRDCKLKDHDSANADILRKYNDSIKRHTDDFANVSEELKVKFARLVEQQDEARATLLRHMEVDRREYARGLERQAEEHEVSCELDSKRKALFCWS